MLARSGIRKERKIKYFDQQENLFSSVLLKCAFGIEVLVWCSIGTKLITNLDRLDRYLCLMRPSGKP